MNASRSLLIGILLILSLFSVHASVNNVAHNYPFDSNFSDSVAGLDLVNPSIGTNFVSGATVKIGNGSLNDTANTGSNNLHSESNVTVPSVWTVNLWYFPKSTESPSGDRNLFWYYNTTGTTPNFRIGVGLHHNGSLFIESANNSASQGKSWIPEDTTVLTGSWNMISVVFVYGTNPVFYINGTRQTTLNETPINWSDTTTNPPVGRSMKYFVSGGGKSGYTSYGTIDELSVWNKALTDADITGLYAAGAGLAYPYSNASNLNFTVSLPSLGPLQTYEKVSMQENASDFRYRYALVCDWRQTTLWSDVFTSFYNNSLHNTTVTGNTGLTFNGLLAHINSDANFSYEKIANSGYRTIADLNFLYTLDASNSIDYLQLSDAQVVTYYLRIQRNGTNLSVYRVGLFPSTITQIASTTTLGSASVSIPLTIEYTPAHDSFNNIDYFITNIKYNNASIGTDSTYTFPGTNLKDFQLYSEFTANQNMTNLTLKSINLIQTSNPNPDFITFQNGEVDESSGSKVITAPTEASITCASDPNCIVFPGPIIGQNLQDNASDPEGTLDCDPIAQLLYPFFCDDPASLTSEEFTTFGGNNEFFSQCTYQTPGTYIQRHFVTATTGIDDWGVYNDVSVTVTGNISDNTVPILPSGETAIVPPGGKNPITDALSAAGVGAVGAFFMWLIVCIIFAASIGKVTESGTFGLGALVLGLLAGWPLGVIPLWFLLMFAILSGGIVALTFRWFYAGS